jgi:hypothetical protein
MINGKIHYKWSFSIAMLNYQRVILFIWGAIWVVFHGWIPPLPLDLAVALWIFGQRRAERTGGGAKRRLRGHPKKGSKMPTVSTAAAMGGVETWRRKNHEKS